MTIPSPSTYPEKMDDDQNLFLVRDSLRVKLSEDYKKGDASIRVEGSSEMMAKFPPTGIITLTEQCSDIDLRALSFHYSSKTQNSFEGLLLLPEFKDLDSSKPKRATNVTMNVVSVHHNHLKDALIQIEQYLGAEYNTKEGTITDRIRTLQKTALSPKAWFSADKTYGVARDELNPLKVRFTNESLRLGDGPTRQIWKFKNKTSGEEIELLPIDTENSEEYRMNRVQEHSFYPGRYDVSLYVRNQYGEDEVVFEDMIVARRECPEEAVININHSSSQNYDPGDVFLGTRPKVRSPVNVAVDLEVPEGENPSNPGYSYGGESLSSPVDPIREYSWILGDDLPHANSRFARALYDKGGYYDITLRVDTSFGSYRITTYEKSIDIVEQSNLWLFVKNTQSNSSSSSVAGEVVQAYEFGLTGETFKTLGNSVVIDRNNSFLSEYDSEDYYQGVFDRAKKEFDNNVEFTRSGSLDSGDRGESIMFWAKGGVSSDTKQIGVMKYRGFDDVYESLPAISDRPWNWVAMSSSEKTYFVFGRKDQDSVLSERIDYDLLTASASSPITLSSSDFENGADELLVDPSYGVETAGDFVSYRSAWKDQTGYLLRNSSVNEFFRISKFYKTKGSLSSPFEAFTKMPDMPGSVKTEGQIVALSNGIFFFNNSGEICAWNDTSLVWEVGRASSTSLSFRSVQDTSTQGFDDRSNTLKASSDGDRVAYLSYDYSNKAFIKFNGTDLTFTMLKSRPQGEQFKMGVY